MNDPEIPKEDPATWGPATGPPQGLADVGTGGFWVTCEALGWPLDALGGDAAVYVLPSPSPAYKAALRDVMNGKAPDSAEAWLAVEEALPALYAQHIMTAMRGIRLQAAGPILEDTAGNREEALRTSYLLLDRVQMVSHTGPPGETWREVAIRQRHALGEAYALLTAGMFQGVPPLLVLREVYGRIGVALGRAQIIFGPAFSGWPGDDDGGVTM